MYSCEAEDTFIRTRIWSNVSNEKTTHFYPGDLFAFGPDSLRITNEFLPERTIVAPYFTELPEGKEADSPFFLVQTTEPVTIALFRRDSFADRVKISPFSADSLSTGDLLASGYTYRTVIGADTFIFHYNDRYDSDRPVFTYNDRGPLRKGEIAYSGLRAGGEFIINKTEDSDQFSVLTISRKERYRANRFDCRIRSAASDGTVRAECLAYHGPSSAAEVTKVKFAFERLPELIPPEVENEKIIELLNTGRIEIEHYVDNYDKKQFNYEDPDDFTRRGGIAYRELPSLSVDFAPDGVFNLLAGEKSIQTGRWSFSNDRRYLIVSTPGKSNHYVIPIRSWSPGSITISLNILVATPINHGVKMMSYVRTPVEMTVSDFAG